MDYLCAPITILKQQKPMGVRMLKVKLMLLLFVIAFFSGDIAADSKF